MKISVIIPCYNEENTIGVLLERVKNSKIGSENSLEIIIVDDGSTDKTQEILKKLSEDSTFKIICHTLNKGKGSAIRSGIGACTGDIVIIQDADLEYDPNEYEKLINPIIKNKAEVVYGSRYLDFESRKGRPLGTALLTIVTNLLYGSHLTDEPTCYKVFKWSVLRDIKLSSVRFEFCPEVTAKILKRGISIKEVQISYKRRTKSEGKKLRWFHDGLEALYTLLKYRFID